MDAEFIGKAIKVGIQVVEASPEEGLGAKLLSDASPMVRVAGNQTENIANLGAELPAVNELSLQNASGGFSQAEKLPVGITDLGGGFSKDQLDEFVSKLRGDGATASQASDVLSQPPDGYMLIDTTPVPLDFSKIFEGAKLLKRPFFQSY